MTIATPSATFTRPANTTQYVVAQLVANSVTNTSVVPLSWLITANIKGNVLVRRCRLNKSTNSLTSANFRLHLYETSPTLSNGDGAAWLTTTSGYLGSMDITVDKAFADPASQGSGVPNTGNEIIIDGTVDKTIYGLVEARATYTPGSAEVFIITLEVYSGN